jgi:hypothetical protein
MFIHLPLLPSMILIELHYNKDDALGIVRDIVLVQKLTKELKIR